MKKAIRITAVTLSACLLAATSMFGVSAKEVTFHKTAYIKGSIAGVKDADIYVVDKEDFDQAEPTEKAAEQNKLSAAFDEGKMITFTGDADVLNQADIYSIVGAKGALIAHNADVHCSNVLRGLALQKTSDTVNVHEVYIDRKNVSDRQADNTVVKSVAKSYKGLPSEHEGEI